MEFLHSFLITSFSGETIGSVANVGCFHRIFKIVQRNNFHGSSETSFTFKKLAPSTAPTAEKVQHDPHKP